MSENQAQQAMFSLEKIYLKDASYEAPGAPTAFLENQAPEVNVQLALEHHDLDPAQGYHEVVLSVQVNAKRQDKAMFLVEVQQAGVFRVQGITGEPLQRTLEVACAYMLLPFARESISDFIGKGGFPQLLINPINFDALYEQKRLAAQQPVGQA